MQQFSIIFFLLLLYSGTVMSQDNIPFVARFIALESDNDYYTFTRTTDRYYSNGTVIRYQDPRLGNGFLGLRKIFPFKNIHTNTSNTYRIELIHQIFTAGDIRYTEADQIDRPYAGLFQLAINNNSFTSNMERQLIKRIHIGWIGPGALGKEFQDWYHRLTNWPLAEGWAYQVKNQFTFGADLQWKQFIISSPNSNMLRLAYQGTWSLANHSAHLEGGLKFILGAPIELMEPQKKLSLSIWTGIDTRWVWWNRLIDGPLAPGRDLSGYQIPILKRIITHGEMGILLRYHLTDFTLSQHFLSPEFNGGQTHFWVSFKLRRYF